MLNSILADEPQRSRPAWIAVSLIIMASLGACATDTTPAPQPVADETPLTTESPSEVRLKRLTKQQFTNAVHDVLGEQIAVPISLEPDLQEHGFLSIGASSSGISLLGTERYEKAALDIAQQVMEASKERDALIGCTPSTTTDRACTEGFVKRVGKNLFRRPLTADEVERYVTVGEQAQTTLKNFHEGLRFSLAGLLQSPHFLFRIELGEQSEAGRVRYTDFEMATRLSFFLWNTTPDEALLAAAEAGSLSTDEGLRIEVDRMLESERSRQGIRNFFSERFELYKLDQLAKDAELFTSMSPELGPDAREQTLRTVEDLVFDRDGDYRELMTSRRTFLNRRLAALYAVPAPSLEGFAATELPSDGPRRGLLGHASLLAMHAHSVSSSATLRGVFIRSHLLCQHIPPAPADVNTTLPEPSKDMPTLRDRLSEHRKNPSCASCHQLLDPIGLGLERFDGLGQYRTTENGATIDPSGELDGTDFGNASELGEALATHPDLARCLVFHLYNYATSHEATIAEGTLLSELLSRFELDGFRIKPLLRHIAMSEGFRHGSPAPAEPSEEGDD